MTNSSVPSSTLRQVGGLSDALPRLGDAAALILIDFQDTYRSGVMALEGVEEALAAGARLLARARAAGVPVVHVQHDGGPGSPYDIRADIGRISAEVAPVEGEEVVVKNFPNSFHRTELEKVLAALGVPGDGTLVLAGLMTHMCVNYTAQGAFNLGYQPVVVAEATATRALRAPDGTVVPAEVLKSAALTGISDIFAVVAPKVDDLLG
ncbi:isochorismatase family protein [Streptomyces sp. CA-294286]|uniref:isochorismatase family protein n=1 Tax=Streptomyces sp. CA-294286 TaxID=3240070 RepID=UPI003D8A2F8B